MLVHAPVLLVAKIREHRVGVRLSKRAISVAQHDKHPILAKADDVCEAAVGEVSQEARVSVHAPVLVLGKVVEHRIRKGLAERAVAIAQRDPHTVLTKADDVGKSAVCQVRKKSRVTVDAPVLRVAIVRDGDLRPLKRAVAVADRRPHILVAEADDVGPAIAVEIDDEARVPIDPPASRLVPEVGDHDLRILKTAVAVAERGPHAAVAEADDVGKAASGQRREESWMFVDAPSERGGNVENAPSAKRAGHIELGGIPGCGQVSSAQLLPPSSDSHRFA